VYHVVVARASGRGWRASTVLGLSAVVTLTSCTEHEARVSGPVVPNEQFAQLVPLPNEIPSGEVLFASLARVAPSSSGFFFDRLGRIVVNVASPADGPAAVQAAQGFLARRDIAVANPSGVTVIWRPVKHSYAQLATWRNLVFDSVFTRSTEFVSLDLDEVGNRLMVGAKRGRASYARQALVPLLVRTGADTTALEVFERDPLSLSWSTLTQTSNPDPLVGGLAIGSVTANPTWTCTLGFVAADPQVWGLGFVTASHCPRVAQQYWAVNNHTANQTWNGPLAGTERWDPSGWQCGPLNQCRRSDAAFYQQSAGRPMARGLIARPIAFGSGNVNTADPYFIITGESNGFYGQQVYKIGWETTWTSGSILSTCIDHNLTDYVPVKTVKCTNESTNPDEDGDSGGPIFIPVGGPYVYLAGTTIGGANTITGTGWSTISQIQLDFNNGFTGLLTTRIANLTTPSISGSLSGTSPRLSWSPVSGASVYHVYQSIGGAFTYKTSIAGSPYTDGQISATGVFSSPPPAPWAAYYISAQGGTEYSLNSNVVYFQRPAAISVSIQGQFQIRPNDSCYWTANASGGTGAYSYAWTVNGQPVGSNSSQLFYTNTGSSFTLAVTVTDGSSTPGADSRSVSVSFANPSCGF